MQEISDLLQKIVKNLFDVDEVIELTRTDEQFGDYATNVALRLSKKLGRNPREIATEIAGNLKNESIEKAEVAGPGFINLTLSSKALKKLADDAPGLPLKGQVIVAEYSDPNPFKVLHAGHLYTSVVGDAIANLLEYAGAEVHRVNFGGDVGRHVGQTMWAILDEFGGEYPEKLEAIEADKRSEWLAQNYIKGTNSFEDDETAKAEIISLNKKIYQIHSDGDKLSPLAQIYWTTRQWSYDYFDAFYERIGTHFEKYYPESVTAELGLKTVKEHIGDVYVESDGAVVFEAEKHGLHTRVFINREGLPTYEAKDVGLIMLKKQDYNFDRSVIMTGNEQMDYMKVVLKSIEQFAPELVAATTHLTHGLVKLAGGVKMSSRKGNILRAVDVLEVAAEANKVANAQQDESISLGAVKYAFLKVRTGGDIIYDPNESVSLQGNSGPYLQYAHARACSILSKSSLRLDPLIKPEDDKTGELDAAERSLLRKISEYNEVVEKAVTELMPHHICTYLYELAQTFNRFYEQSHVIGDEREQVRIQLVSKYANRLKSGLELLGIHAPEKM